MKAARVQYTVQPGFAETNKANIRKVMDALKANPIDGLRYAAFTLDDNQTFVHVVITRDDIQNQLADLTEFKEFLTALRESGPVKPPAPKEMNFVGASFEI